MAQDKPSFALIFQKTAVFLKLAAAAILLLHVFAGRLTAGQIQDPPRWELGLGAGMVTMPAYRGSEIRQYYPGPLPYLIYRGDFLKIDREGIRGLIYESPRLKADLSADGALPSSSRKGDAREKMPDLATVGEIGPSLNYLLYENSGLRLQLRLPVRAVFASDLTFLEHEGWKAHPQVKLEADDAAAGWDLGLILGPVFADRKYHSYYYEVSPAHATEKRPAYSAGAGYSGSFLQFSAGRKSQKLWAGFFIRYDNLAGAVFEDSPLVETRHSFSWGLGAAWIFTRSSDTVPADR